MSATGTFFPRLFANIIPVLCPPWYQLCIPFSPLQCWWPRRFRRSCATHPVFPRCLLLKLLVVGCSHGGWQAPLSTSERIAYPCAAAVLLLFSLLVSCMMSSILGLDLDSLQVLLPLISLLQNTDLPAPIAHFRGADTHSFVACQDHYPRYSSAAIRSLRRQQICCNGVKEVIECSRMCMDIRLLLVLPGCH